MVCVLSCFESPSTCSTLWFYFHCGNFFFTLEKQYETSTKKQPSALYVTEPASMYPCNKRAEFQYRKNFDRVLLI